MTDDFWSTKALLFPTVGKAGMKGITGTVQGLTLSYHWVAIIHTHPPEGLDWVATERHTQVGSSHGNVQEVGMEVRPLHMRQQHAPWAAWVLWGTGKAGHSCDVACSKRRPSGRQRRC